MKGERPYQHDSTASRLLSEVKHVRAWLVLRWGTTLESQVLFSFLFCKFLSLFLIFLLHSSFILYSSSSSILQFICSNRRTPHIILVTMICCSNIYINGFFLCINHKSNIFTTPLLAPPSTQTFPYWTHTSSYLSSTMYLLSHLIL
jgi:hypothetical protein